MTERPATLSPSVAVLTAVLFTLALLLGTATPAQGAEHHVTIAPGETLASVANHFYGAEWKQVYLEARNDIPRPGEDLRVGQKLWIPGTWEYRVRRADALAHIAKRYLGGAYRYEMLMHENGVQQHQDLKVGRRLVLPFHLKHKVERGDSYARLARRYYRRSRHAGLLKRYNRERSLHPGITVVVPIFDRAALDVHKREQRAVPERHDRKLERKQAASTGRTPRDTASDNPETTRPGGARVAQKDTTARTATSPPQPPSISTLAEATAALAAGHFEPACQALAGLGGAAAKGALQAWRRQQAGDFASPKPATSAASPKRSRSQQIALWRGLGTCAIANGDQHAAQAYFAQWVALEPLPRLDPVETSPKIRNLVEQVARQTQMRHKQVR